MYLYIHRRLSSFAKGWQGVSSEAENLGVGGKVMPIEGWNRPASWAVVLVPGFRHLQTTLGMWSESCIWKTSIEDLDYQNISKHKPGCLAKWKSFKFSLPGPRQTTTHVYPVNDPLTQEPGNTSGKGKTMLHDLNLWRLNLSSKNHEKAV